MKTIRNAMFALVGAAHIACGGVSDGEIQDALDNAGVVESRLNYKIGEKITRKRVVVERGDVGAGLTGSDVQYKFENGTATPCNHANAQNSTTDCGVTRSVVRTETTESTTEVKEKADLAFSELPGFVMEDTRKFTVDEQYWWPVAGTASSGNVPVVTDGLVRYVVGERNAFVVRVDEGGEGDVGNSSTLFPAGPEAGRTYTDDEGRSWTVTGIEKLTAGSTNVAAAAMTVATNKQVFTLAELKEKCFSRRGVTASTFDVARHGDCAGKLNLVYERSLKVGLDLVLRETFKTVEIEIVDWGVRDVNGALLTNNVANSNTSDYVFFYTAVEREVTDEVTDIAF